MKRFFLFSLFILLIFGNLFSQENLPKIKREFRAMWIATVANIDFPSSPNLSATQQKAEIIKLLDLAGELKFNAVIFQIRPMCDALYESKIEPTSYFLTGQQGKKLEFDPLKFAIDEAHSRGILLHAWFNPYRASHATMKGEFAENHITKLRPDLVRKYNDLLILDPSEKDVQNYVAKVVLDVVKRYDIDGVHFDDYFYPYPDKQNTPFPDEKNYTKYQNSDGKLSLGDWRRKNVDDFIKLISVGIKRVKPQVMFGISPFGIWKPDGENIKGFDAYNQLYADSKKWLQEGWVDYLSPQLYWSSTQNGVKFPVLIDWWKSQNTKKRHIWIGIATYRADKPDFGADEIANQISITRNTFAENSGNIHFNAKPILNNLAGVQDILREKVYNEDALIPLTAWIKTTSLKQPSLNFQKQTNGEIIVSWKNLDKKMPFQWVLYWKDSNAWQMKILTFNQTKFSLPRDLNVKMVAVSSVDRLGNLSKAMFKKVK
jgi:uncharacterized lipoprotein YddW (UPF0748 family)